jgi:SAM-dependent methyltransferase
MLAAVPLKDAPNMAEIQRIFMFDHAEDVRLEKRNLLFWRALLGHIQADRAIEAGATILDVGCHRGGLLELAIDRFKPASIIGIEPLKPARNAAQQKLGIFPGRVQILSEKEWNRIPDISVDLLLSHEVLPFFDDLQFISEQMGRVLKPGAFAYMVSGCHTENPLWPRWKEELQVQGHIVYDHSPLDLMRAVSITGFSPSVRPLRESGWAHYNPIEQDAFEYPSVQALLDHQFKHKLLFRFQRSSN